MDFSRRKLLVLAASMPFASSMSFARDKSSDESTKFKAKILSKKTPDFFTLVPAFKSGNEKETTISLIDKMGHVQHSWKIKDVVLYCFLDASGSLWVQTAGDASKSWIVPTGAGKKIMKLNFRSEILAPIDATNFHHCPYVTEQEKILCFQWTPLSKSHLDELKKRYSVDESRTYFTDELVQVDLKGQKTVLWNFFDSFKIADLNFELEAASNEIAHGNSVQYIDSNPFDGEPAVLLSFRAFSRMALIRVRDKKMLWISPEGLTFQQHDAQLVSDGALICFDNAMARTRYLKIDIRTNNVLAQRFGGHQLHHQLQFHSSVVGNVQRLSTGEIFCVDGQHGLLSLISQSGDLLWQMWGPESEDPQSLWPYQFLHHVRAYPASILKTIRQKV